MTEKYRVAGTVVVLSAVALSAAGCMGPTYGTDKPAAVQLMDDIGDAASLSPSKKAETLAYQPRGALVKPTDDTLIPPEKNIAGKDNPQWVESPEETRDRLRAEADENANNGTYRSPLAKSVTEGKTTSPEQQREAFQQARKIQDGRYSDRRLFMSDPPLDYRKVDPSKLTDLGKPEDQKAKERKKQAEIANSGTHWWEVWK